MTDTPLYNTGKELVKWLGENPDLLDEDARLVLADLAANCDEKSSPRARRLLKAVWKSKRGVTAGEKILKLEKAASDTAKIVAVRILKELLMKVGLSF